MVRHRNATQNARTTRCALAALVVLTLGACASSREFRGAPVGDVAVASEQAVETRIDSVLQASNGESIALSVWPAKGRERGVILGVHGFGDYGLSTFAMAAEEWREAGLTVYAYDQRGFGRNPSNGVWPGADRLVEDLGVVTDHVRLREGDAPLTVVGHSMGGAVVTAALGEGRIAPDRAVLLAPALWGGENLGIGYRALATMAVTLFPDKRWSGNGVVRIRATDNIEVLRSISRDPLYVRNPSSREFAGLIALMDRAVASAPTVGVPTLVLFGTQDEVVPEEPTRETAALFAGPTEFRIMESGWHLLLRDLEGGRVRDAVADYALGAPLSRVARTSTKARIPGER